MEKNNSQTELQALVTEFKAVVDSGHLTQDAIDSFCTEVEKHMPLFSNSNRGDGQFVNHVEIKTSGVPSPKINYIDRIGFHSLF